MSSVTPPTDPRVARSRARLLKAAIDLLVASGPAAVTVDAVSERSGVAKSTLYRHWGSRDELLLDVVRGHVPDVALADLSQGFAAALREQLRAAAVALADPEWQAMLPSMLALQQHEPQIATLMEADRAATASILQRILDVGVAEGVVPQSIDAPRTLQLLVGPLVFAVLTRTSDDLVGLADEIVDRFIASCR